MNERALVPVSSGKEFPIMEGVMDTSKRIKKKKRKKKRKTYEQKVVRPNDKAIIERFIDQCEKIPKTLKRHLKEIETNPLALILTNLPPYLAKEELLEFFNTFLRNLDSKYEEEDINPISHAEVGFTGKYAVLRFVDSKALWKVLKLSSIEMKEFKLRFHRPRGFFTKHFGQGDYFVDEAGEVQNRMQDGQVRLYMGNIPQYMTEDQIKTLVSSFGALKDFQMKMEFSQGESLSKGYCFFEFFDSRNAEKALLKLNGLEIGQKLLKVSKVEVNQQAKEAVTNRTAPTKEVQTSFLLMYPKLRDPLVQAALDIPLTCITPSKVIQLLNMMMIEDLFEEDFYRRLLEDVESETKTFGPIESIVIPRPDPESGICAPCVGKVFVKFFYLKPAKQARHKLNGRTYNKRTVIASFYAEEKFDRKEYLVNG